MTTEQALYAAVLANPADDVVRKAYADGLRENGQEERADFIEVQLELAQMLSLPTWTPKQESQAGKIRRRERELWPAVGLAMREQCLPLFDNLGIEAYAASTVGRSRCAVVRRGFPEVVYCTLADWCGGRHRTCTRCNYVAEHPWEDRCPSCNSHRLLQYPQGIGPQIVKRHPVERVVLVDRDPVNDPDSGFWWVIDTPDSRAAPIPTECLLPAKMFNFLTGFQVNTSHTRCYVTREDAIEALSPAAIAWAKGVA